MYRVKLQNFEGPLDLLLFFIKRDELNIYNIPIAYITEQFLEYLKFMEELNLDIASEFIYMASTLMSIKAQMMLPRENELNGDGEWEEDDPRYELVQRLLEYKRYKEMAEKISVLERENQQFHPRGNTRADTVEPEPDGEALKDITVFDLISAYRNVLLKVEKRDHSYHRVEKTTYTVENQSEYVREFLMKNGRSSFRKLIETFKKRIPIVVTFLAILEMVKEQQLDMWIKNPAAGEVRDFELDLKSVDGLYAGA